MIELTPEQKSEFFHRSYKTVDGLWFMKVEERYDFEAALDIDDEVWKVFPKIQARMLKEMTGMKSGVEALFQCLITKMELDGFEFTAEKREDNLGFQLFIRGCPWHDVMVKSGRESLSEKVGGRICDSEYSVWVSEFSGDMKCEFKSRICRGADHCILAFGS
ncbi:DUF6125 family protein [Chloroflexota bacterium]